MCVLIKFNKKHGGNIYWHFNTEFDYLVSYNPNSICYNKDNLVQIFKSFID